MLSKLKYTFINLFISRDYQMLIYGENFFNKLEMVNCQVIVHWIIIYVSRETLLVANIICL